jgi:hypothetical protein
MKAEQIKEITDRATEQLVAALQSGHSEALTAYLKIPNLAGHLKDESGSVRRIC